MLFWLPLAFIGFDPLMIMTMQFVSLSIQALLHTQIIRSYGFLDYFLNSPSHHRVHHGTQDFYLDRNFGGVLIVWDKLFGTFTKETEQPVFGIGWPQSSGNPLKIAFSELYSILKEFRQSGLLKGLVSLFHPPGWRRP
jgi:sterol desaturase/sphingolipid hydroxylase (fatty acid hydroxylase superfamily)